MKLCECGCGIEVANNKNKFITGHNMYLRPIKEKIKPTKLCECGCKEIVSNDKNRFIRGHRFRIKASKEILEKREETRSKNKGKIKEIKLCKCGCGEYTKPGNNYIFGHSRRKNKTIQLCNCGCGEYTKPGNIFITGHNGVGTFRTDETKKKMGDWQKRENNPNWKRRNDKR